MSGRWEFWIDRGGTFTDIVARRPDGSLTVRKLLSENPGRYADPAVEGIRRLLQVPGKEPIPAERIAAVRLGTTVATNALLERKGEPTVLVITRGFADAIRIAYQDRPRIFERQIIRPEMLYSRVIEASERIGAHGEVIVPLDEHAVAADLRAAHDEGFRSVAVVCMHGYRYPRHEALIGEIARRAGFTQVSESHATSPLMKLVSRGDTTLVDAYLSPILQRYVDQVTAELSGVRLQFMQSSGGLTDARLFRGKDSILSGPAGGIVGMGRPPEGARFGAVIGFDMGGTSTDVSHYAGEFERQYETLVAGVRMRAPMLSIHTVAAGGGSILHFNGSRYRVRPDSAGAGPGPPAARGGGGRRDPAVRREGGPGRPGPRRGGSRAGRLPAWRPADRDGRQRHAGPDPAGALPPGVRCQRGSAAGRRDRPGALRRPGRGDRRGRWWRDRWWRGRWRRGRWRRAQRFARARAGRRGISGDRGGQHGQRDQEDLGPAWLRRHVLRAGHLRRRGWPARLRRGRRTGHDQGADPPARRGAVGVGDGARRGDRDAGIRGRGAAVGRPGPGVCPGMGRIGGGGVSRAYGRGDSRGPGQVRTPGAPQV